MSVRLSNPLPGSLIDPGGRWDTPRPRPPATPKYLHAGLDLNRIARDWDKPGARELRAAEDADAFAFALHRHDFTRDAWPDELRRSLLDDRAPQSFPWIGHFHDIYGPIIALRGRETGWVHLYCHSWFNLVFDKTIFPRAAWSYQEEKRKGRFPLFLWNTFGHHAPVKRGDVVGVVGSAGDSTGDHLHWEVHLGWESTPRPVRPDPEKHLEGA
jgi:hypothetical protein